VRKVLIMLIFIIVLKVSLSMFDVHVATSSFIVVK